MTKSFINLISASDISALTAFSSTLIKKMITVPEIITLVCDEKNYYSSIQEIHSKSFSEIQNIIFSSERNKPMLLFIAGVEKWISTLSDEIRNDLISFFAKINDLHNCFFVLVDRLEDIKSLNYEKWFKQFVSTDTSIFIGRGLNNSTIHSLVTPLRSLSVLIPDNYGYNIKNGIATKIKVIEGEIVNGK